MTIRRSIHETIDEMLGIIPVEQTEFIAQLDLLSQMVHANDYKESKTVLAFHWDCLAQIYEQYINKPTKPWHFQLASLIFKRPVVVNF